MALGAPLLLGLALTGAGLDPVRPPPILRVGGWALIVLFAGWNGWALAVMARHRTGLLPGQSTTTLLERGPFRLSRNPLYLGLILLDVGVALLARSFWALLAVPLGVLALRWGAIVPEERYLGAEFGADYLAYRRRVRRWL